MAFNLIFAQEAESDIIQAIDYYNSKQEDLGRQFYLSLSHKISLIQDTPEIFPFYKSRYRKSILGNFPYTLFFSVESNMIIVYGIIHQSRGPEFLKNRLH